MIKLRRINSSFPDFARKGGSDGLIYNDEKAINISNVE